LQDASSSSNIAEDSASSAHSLHHGLAPKPQPGRGRHQCSHITLVDRERRPTCVTHHTHTHTQLTQPLVTLRIEARPQFVQACKSIHVAICTTMSACSLLRAPSERGGCLTAEAMQRSWHERNKTFAMAKKTHLFSSASQHTQRVEPHARWCRGHGGQEQEGHHSPRRPRHPASQAPPHVPERHENADHALKHLPPFVQCLEVGKTDNMAVPPAYSVVKAAKVGP
jgi:hypothetical protein